MDDSEDNKSEILYPNEPTRFTEQEFDKLLNFCVIEKTSDITIQSSDRVMAEIHGQLLRITKRKITHNEVNGTFLILEQNLTGKGRIDGAGVQAAWKKPLL